jgi:hypothetical protein
MLPRPMAPPRGGGGAWVRRGSGRVPAAESTSLASPSKSSLDHWHSESIIGRIIRVIINSGLSNRHTGSLVESLARLRFHIFKIFQVDHDHDVNGIILHIRTREIRLHILYIMLPIYQHIFWHFYLHILHHDCGLSELEKNEQFPLSGAARRRRAAAW